MRYVAAVALVLVTLSVFYVLQYYGPESAIRRFHRAVQSKRYNELQLVTSEKVETQAVGRLFTFVEQMNQSGGRYRLLRVERQPKEVYAALEYVLPSGETYATVWVVEKSGAVWKVDAQKTVGIIYDGYSARPNGG